MKYYSLFTITLIALLTWSCIVELPDLNPNTNAGSEMIVIPINEIVCNDYLDPEHGFDIDNDGEDDIIFLTRYFWFF